MGTINYSYSGTVLPDSTRISAPRMCIPFLTSEQYPAGVVSVEISNNRVIAGFSTDTELTFPQLATVRNIIQDVATSIGRGKALPEGAWVLVTIDSCTGPDGGLRYPFSNSHASLKAAFAKYDINFDDIAAINSHSSGFYFRLALDDITMGLIDLKFLRSHFYKAIESLRNAIGYVCAPDEKDKKALWLLFKSRLNIRNEDFSALEEHNERHANYSHVKPLTGAEVDHCFSSIAKVLAAFIQWHKGLPR